MRDFVLNFGNEKTKNTPVTDVVSIELIVCFTCIAISNGSGIIILS